MRFWGRPLPHNCVKVVLVREKVHLGALVEVAKVEGAGSIRAGASCFPNLLVMRAVFSVPVGDLPSTLPKGHCSRQPKHIYDQHKLAPGAPHQAKGTQFIIRREVALQEKKGEWGLRGRGQGKVEGGQPHSG